MTLNATGFKENQPIKEGHPPKGHSQITSTLNVRFFDPLCRSLQLLSHIIIDDPSLTLKMLHTYPLNLKKWKTQIRSEYSLNIEIGQIRTPRISGKPLRDQRKAEVHCSYNSEYSLKKISLILQYVSVRNRKKYFIIYRFDITIIRNPFPQDHNLSSRYTWLLSPPSLT